MCLNKTVANELSRKQFEYIADIIFREAGITLPENKMPLVNTRLSKRLRAIGYDNFKDYCELLKSKEERRFLLTALTTNTTKFFREPHHFDYLKTVRLPKLIAEARAGGRVRIWSAACSSGEEPYSIAMTVLAVAPEVSSYDFKILATDIDYKILEDARQGVYTEKCISNIPTQDVDQYFTCISEETQEKTYIVKQSVRNLITFNEINLIKTWPVKGPFDDIFCRNVVIYFDQETSQQIWKRFAEKLKSGGCLYIGHSERVTGPASSSFKTSGITTYTKL